MKKSQKDRVVGQLLANGYITRNQCLRNYISRLSAIIQVLEEEGWQFSTKDDKGDYVYMVTKCPLRKIVYKLSNGETIEKYEK